MLTAVEEVLVPVYNLSRGQYQSATKDKPKTVTVLQARNFWFAPHVIFHSDKNKCNSHNKTNKCTNVSIFYLTRNEFHNIYKHFMHNF